MRLRFPVALLAAVLLYFACDSTLTGPTPPPSGPPASPQPPPRVDQPFSLDTYQGYIAFGLGEPSQDEFHVRSFVLSMMTQGWNTPQVCSETEFWSGPGYPTKPRDTERLRWLLDVIARIPGAQVALVGNCTLKRQIPLEEQFQWAQQVAMVAQEFRNVAIFTHNEFDNCAGRHDWGGNGKWCAGKNEVAKHVQMFRGNGFSVVTADDSIGPRVQGDSEEKSFGFRLTNIGASPASFHPAREKGREPWDPDQKFLTKVARYNGTFILSETVAWMDYSGRCDGLRTCDPDRVDQCIATCAAVPECRFTLHSENLLMGVLPTRIPTAR